MAASITSIQKTSANSWLYTWSGTSPYKIFMNGANILGENDATTTETSMTFLSSDAVEPPAVEIQDATATTTALSLQFSGAVVLQWRGETANVFYKVQKFNTAINLWQDVSSLNLSLAIRESGQGYYQFVATDEVDDLTTTNFRVTATDNVGNVSFPLEYEFDGVRNPAVPKINSSYDGTDLTFTERT